MRIKFEEVEYIPRDDEEENYGTDMLINGMAIISVAVVVICFAGLVIYNLALWM